MCVDLTGVLTGVVLTFSATAALAVECSGLFFFGGTAAVSKIDPRAKIDKKDEIRKAMRDADLRGKASPSTLGFVAAHDPNTNLNIVQNLMVLRQELSRQPPGPLELSSG